MTSSQRDYLPLAIAAIGLGLTQWSTAVIYLMMLLVLLFRPRGLFGERIQRFE